MNTRIKIELRSDLYGSEVFKEEYDLDGAMAALRSIYESAIGQNDGVEREVVLRFGSSDEEGDAEAWVPVFDGKGQPDASSGT